MRSAVLEHGELRRVAASNGDSVEVRLNRVRLERDSTRGAVRGGMAELTIEGEAVRLPLGLYHMPTRVGGFQIDAPLVIGESSIRLRIWPRDAPLLRPGTFCYPVKNRWMRSVVQSSGEVVFAKSEAIRRKDPYYHFATDIGGCKDVTEVVAAADGIVVGVRGDLLPREEGALKSVFRGSDQVFLKDGRGWLYKYSHMSNESVELGQRVRLGDLLGTLSTTGTSGGWAHLHFEVLSPAPSGDWVTEDAFPFLTEAFFARHPSAVLAVARPHKVAHVGETVRLSGCKSLGGRGERLEYEWRLENGEIVRQPSCDVRYDAPGRYSEVLIARAESGACDYAFGLVEVQDPSDYRRLPGMHVEYDHAGPLAPGEPVRFYFRCFDGDYAGEPDGVSWDFGDEAPHRSVAARSADDYRTLEHTYDQPGDYVVTCRLQGVPVSVTQKLHVRIRDTEPD